MQNPAFSTFEAGKHHKCLDFLACTGIMDNKIFPDTDIIPYFPVIQIRNPVFSHELAVGKQTVNCFTPEQPDIPVHYSVKIAYLKAVAEWIYFIDALDDYEKDVKKRRFNPLINKSHTTHIDYINSNFPEICRSIRHFYQEIRNVANKFPQSCVEDELQKNIICNTIPTMTATVLNKNKKPKLRHFRAGTVWSNNDGL